MRKLFFIFFSLFISANLLAEEYQSPDAFVSEIFSGKAPKAKSFWLAKAYKQPVTDILQHKPGFMRTRYWQQGDKTVWVLNEIGKTKPITVGIVVENDAITLLKVLAFRESRGWEVRHTFFTRQFLQVTLSEDNSLSKQIDGISGATLSVRALRKTAQLALYFTQQIQQ